MPVCPCCQRDLSESTIRRHRLYGPSINDKIRAYANNPSRNPFPEPRRKTSSARKMISPSPLLASKTSSIHAILPENLPGPSECYPKEIPIFEENIEDSETESTCGDSNGRFENANEENTSDESEEDFATAMIKDYESNFLAERTNEIYLETSRSNLDMAVINNIKMFVLYTEAKLSRESFNLFKKFFGQTLALLSQYKMQARITTLAGIQTQTYHCCIKSCIAFIGEFHDDDACPKCKSPRYRQDGTPYCTFEYIPLIPRLQAYYRNRAMIEKLNYRITRDTTPNEYADIFDGLLFKDACQRQVIVDGKTYPFKLFQYHTDIALGLSSDGVRIFKRGSEIVWPFFLINYSLPPEIRNQLRYLIPLMVIPGPHEPKDHNSFLIPFHNEMKALAIGVPTFDIISKHQFKLHAYLLTKIADMQAFKKNQYIRGPNAFSPCRSCEIQGCRNPEGPGSNYYYPLNPPAGATNFLQTLPQIWTPSHLPMRTHEHYKESLAFINSTTMNKERERRAKTLGINGESILVDLPGFDRARSGPHDFMHLMYENIQKILIKFWTGQMPFDMNLEQPYLLDQHLWNIIGEETQASTQTIPSYFCRLLPNIATDQHRFIAESWAFWFCYLAPYLLKDRLPTAYYSHFMDLVDIIKTCTQMSTTTGEIDETEQKIIRWVTKYERLYYGYKLERLPACTSCLHAFLHVANDIRQTGPVWVNWAFKTERFVGSIVSVVKSRRFPYAAITRRLIHKTQMSHISLIYDLPDILPESTTSSSEISSQEHTYPGAPLTVFRQPHHCNFSLDAAVHRKIALHLTTEFPRKSISDLLRMVPRTMEMWEKARILDGDRIRVATNKENSRGRDQSFIRYDLLVDKFSHNRRQEPEYISKCFYGQLHLILVGKLLPDTPNQPYRFWALVESCDTGEKDATKELVTYTRMSGRTEIIELQAISCVIGRVKIGNANRWGIIDRSNDMMRASLVVDSDGEE